MLYYLFTYLDEHTGLAGAGVFQYISFRSAAALITSLIITLIIGKRLIRLLAKKQVTESIRKLDLTGQEEKQGTPTMGGIIIIAAIVIPTLLFAKLHNIYIIMLLVVTLWLGAVGFIDDYIKVFKNNKKGLAGKFKILGQIVLGLFVGIVIYFHEDVLVREDPVAYNENSVNIFSGNGNTEGVETAVVDKKATVTTIPFFKNNEFDYAVLLSFLGEGYKKYAFLIFIPIVILIITAVSNGANITDGLDGLATGTSAIIGGTLGIFAYISGNINLADYLNVMYIPNSGELVIFSSALIGACIGFLWYNAYPAQIFMGDTGSLALGGIIAALAIAIRKELMIPLLCGIFLMENLSVILQVGYFKYTKRKFGTGKRIFKMAPLHHHYQKMGYPEAKIVVRFWIVGIFLAVLTIVTLKLR
ncbi:MAG: phospho-N-acetylmuramoyl-pentapeptide-transferase [Bacteroidetes bacterium]|nr:phospho-N-acetylmuramoyl-pentapeptide-transferase [Bacteroidota bacterium]